MLPTAIVDIGPAFTRLGMCEQFGKVAVAIRSNDQVDRRHALEQHWAEPLRHAPDDSEDRSGAFVPLQLPHPPDHTLLRVIANGAGIDEHHISAVGRCRLDVTVPREDTEHQLAVRDVHLATVGLDVDGFHWSKE